jgi:hypothetical protein
LLKYFPEVKNSDEYVKEFTVLLQRNSTVMQTQDLDPDTMPYARPDFGFNDYLTFD